LGIKDPHPILELKIFFLIFLVHVFDSFHALIPPLRVFAAVAVVVAAVAVAAVIGWVEWWRNGSLLQTNTEDIDQKILQKVKNIFKICKLLPN